MEGSSRGVGEQYEMRLLKFLDLNVTESTDAASSPAALSLPPPPPFGWSGSATPPFSKLDGDSPVAAPSPAGGDEGGLLLLSAPELGGGDDEGMEEERLAIDLACCSMSIDPAPGVPPHAPLPLPPVRGLLSFEGIEGGGMRPAAPPTPLPPPALKARAPMLDSE